MNERLQEALASMFESLIAGAKMVGDATTEQIPLVVEEYLRWGMVRSCLGLAALTILSLIIFAALKRLRLHRGVACVAEGCAHPNCGHMKVSYLFGGIILPILAGIILSISFFELAATALKIYTAPRVYLIERVAEFVKK